MRKREHRRGADAARVQGPEHASFPESSRAGRPAPPPAQLAAAAAVAVLAALAVYARALNGGFIWDDPLVLQQLRAIHSWRDLLILPPLIPKFYFRPVIFVSYLADRSLGGESPFWFHVSVLAFHAINVLLVWLLAYRLFPNDWLIPAGGALLFAVFPLHVESVAWMAGRSDVIVGTFILVTMLLFIERQRGWAAWLGGATFLLAVLSKEMALACVVLVPVLDLLSTQRLQCRRYVPLGIATLAYFALRHRALGAYIGGMAIATSPHQIAAEVVGATGFYVLQAIVPAQLCAYVPSVSTDLGHLLVGLLAPALGAGLLITGWKRQRWPVAFLVAWFFATLAPSYTVIVRRSASAPLADRYLYVPSVASCLLLTWLLVRLGEHQRVATRWIIVILIVVSSILGLHAARYAQVWNDDLSFWSDVAAKAPGDALPHRELGAALLRRNRLDQAEHELQRALATRATPEGMAMAYNDLGNLYRRLGRYTDAEQAFEAGIQLRAHPTLYHNLGMTLMAHLEEEQRQGDQAAIGRDIARARHAFEEALRLGNLGASLQGFPPWEAAKTHALLGQVLFSLGDRAAARQHLEAALQLEPSGPVADVTRRYMQRLGP